MTIPHPIPYQGSKRNLAATIVSYFPRDIQRLIEPFAGSAAVSLAAAYHQKCDRFLLNDINAPLIALWDAIVNQPESLADDYETLWEAQSGQERRFYDRVRQRFNQTHQPPDFLFLLARCVKAAVRYNANGEFNQSPDNRRKGRRPRAMKQDILGASRLLHGKTALHTCDYHEVLAEASPDDLVYMDPPYQGVCATSDPRYIEGVSFDAFLKALADLNRRDIAYILSYDGRTGTKTFGESLPAKLELTHIEIDAGRSSQATLLGRDDRTYESLYLSPALVAQLDFAVSSSPELPEQLPLW